jgi:murein DD-endopeptidase MepM/ murein hydrolase activator NlpD
VSAYPRVQGVVLHSGEDITALCNALADREQMPPRLLVATAAFESKLGRYPERRGPWPDISFSPWHITVATAGALGLGDGTNTDDNIGYVRHVLLTDTPRAADLAAQLLGAHWRTTGDPFETFARYNGGGRMTWARLQRDYPQNAANIQAGWTESARYVEAAPPAPSGYVFPIPGGTFEDRHWDGRKAADIFAPAGTPILACTRGRTEVREYPLGGHTVWLFGDDGYTYYHAHCIAGSGVAGSVQTGDPIGRVGNTGNAATTPPHCHWAVGTRGYGIDTHGAGDVAPWPLLRAWLAEEGEDPVRIAELEAEVARLNEVLGEERNYSGGLLTVMGHVQAETAHALTVRGRAGWQAVERANAELLRHRPAEGWPQ